jgi:uncharacterized membrane protein YtjA (UPF0391 family)
MFGAIEGGSVPLPITDLALIFAVIALAAGVFGFGGIVSAAAGIARILFFILLIVFLVTLIAALL